MGYIINEPVIKGKLTNLKVVPDTNQGIQTWQIRKAILHH